MTLGYILSDYLTAAVGFFSVCAAILTSVHIILNKRHTRSAIGWIGAAWLVPILGVVLYLIFGINRIRRRAEQLRGDLETVDAPVTGFSVTSAEFRALMKPQYEYFEKLKHLQDSMFYNPLVSGNRIQPLYNGDEAYPAMLEAIDEADDSITLSTYIFDNDSTGQQFVDALGRAVDRGVETRVLVDAAGLRYSFPSIMSPLRKAGVPTRRYAPSLFPPHLMTINLRNHRKLMVVDGRKGFTGGLNIRRHHVVADEKDHATRDLHFEFEGPVVTQLQKEFANDWKYTTGEVLEKSPWFKDQVKAGDVMARGIPDGPDEHLDKLPWTLLGALSTAQNRVQIATPYFVPESTLIETLVVTAMRGVDIDIVLPATNNLRFMTWAALGTLEPLLQKGVRIWFRSGPFSHSKVMVVDNMWTLVGSSNWDVRSLRLNFEFNVESYNRQLAAEMSEWIQREIEESRRWTLEDHRQQSHLRQLRNKTLRLFGPYL